jgi:hypothetical protein
MSRTKIVRTDKIAWSSWEKRNLLSWLHQHRGMSWNERARAYFRQFRVKRTGEALRCKQNYLLRNLRKLHSIQGSLTETSTSGTSPPRDRREEARGSCLPSLVSFTPRGSRTKTRHLIHALEQLAVSERRRLTDDSDSANERLPGKIKRQPRLRARRANDSIGYTTRLPHTLRSDLTRNASYHWKFVHRTAAATRASRTAAIL